MSCARLLVGTLLQEIAGPVESSVLAQALTPVTEEQQADNTQQLCLQPSLALCHALQQYSPFPSAGPTRPTTTDKSILSGHEHCIFLSLVNHIHINVAGRLHRHVRTLFLWRCDDLVCTAAIPCILDSKKKRYPRQCSVFYGLLLTSHGSTMLHLVYSQPLSILAVMW